MKKLIFLVFFILLILSTVSFGYYYYSKLEDWSEHGKVTTFHKNDLNEVFYDFFLNKTHSLLYSDTNNATDVPLTYDLDGDSLNELILQNTGSVEVRKYNTTSKNFDRLSYSLLAATPLTAPYLYTSSGKLYYIYASKYSFFVFKLNENNFQFEYVADKPLASELYDAQSSDYSAYSANSVVCYGEICHLKESGNFYEVFNLSLISQEIITSKNYTHPYLFTYSINFKPVLVDSFAGFPLVYYPCKLSATQYGLIATYLNGSVFKENCNLITSSVAMTFAGLFSSKLSDDSDFYLIYNTVEGGQRVRSHAISPINLGIANGYASGLMTSATIKTGCMSNKQPHIIFAGNGRMYLLSISKNNLSVSDIDSSSTLGISDIGACIDGAIAFSHGTNITIYSNYLFKKISSHQGQNVIISQIKPNSLQFLIKNSQFLDVYDLIPNITIPPNVTICFRNSIKNNSVGSATYLIMKNDSPFFSGMTNPNTDYYLQTGLAGCEQLKSVLDVGEYNVTQLRSLNEFDFVESDFLPINEKINVTNGAQTFYFYLTYNVTKPTKLVISFFDNVTKFKLNDISSKNYVVVSLIFNKTVIKNINTSEDMILFENLSAGDYIISVSALGYETQIINQYLKGTVYLDVFLNWQKPTKINSPYFLDYDFFAFVKTIYPNGFFNFSELYNISTICVNSTIYINASIVKKDNMIPSLLLSCGQNKTGTIFPSYLVKTSSSSTGNFIYLYNSLGKCTYDIEGAYTIKAVPYSKDFPYSIDSFDSLTSIEKISKNISVTSACVGDLVNDLTKSPEKTENENGFIKKLRENSFTENLTIFLLIWFIVGFVLGALIVNASNEAVGFLYGFGVVGFFDILFFTYVFPLLKGFILFSVVLIVILVITIKSKKQVKE